MKKSSVMAIGAILVLCGCSATKKLEANAPFALGETYAQKWTVENKANEKGYEVVIPILSLTNDEAILKNLYYKGKMTSLEIKLTEIGTIAIAEFGADGNASDKVGTMSKQAEEKPFPFDLTETQAVISYVNNEKVKYLMINGIRQNLTVSYPTVAAKIER